MMCVWCMFKADCVFVCLFSMSGGARLFCVIVLCSPRNLFSDLIGFQCATEDADDDDDGEHR